MGQETSDACQQGLAASVDTDTASIMHTCRARGQGRPGRTPSVPVQCPLL